VTKFKSKPALLQALPSLPDPVDVARFARGAETRTVEPTDSAPPVVTPNQASGAHPVPWEQFDRDAQPHSGLNLRLNSYEHELLKFLARSDKRSIQQTIKRLLIPAAEAAASSLRGERTTPIPDGQGS
jgi:hypothetical protein